MSDNKMGRPPSDNPLSERIYLRVNAETKEILDACTVKMHATRSEVVRKGIYLVRDELENKKQSN
jgi:hypothetical protein